MTALLWIAAYLAVSIVVYIRMVSVCYRRSLKSGNAETWARNSAPTMAGWRAVFWPYAIVHEAARATISKAAWKPVVEEKARHDRLVEDRDAWRVRAGDHSTSVEQRRMAQDIVTTLDDILRREAR